MLSMKDVLTPTRLIVLAVSVFSFIVVTSGLSLAGWRTSAGGVMIVSAALIFPILLDMKTERVFKGYCLVGFGAFIVVWHAVVVDSPLLSEVAKNSMQVLVQMFSIACGGAGGSIIAAHGDTSSTDAATPPGQLSFSSDSQRILNLQSLTKKQTSWLKTLCGLVGALIVAVVFASVLILKS